MILMSEVFLCRGSEGASLCLYASGNAQESGLVGRNVPWVWMLGARGGAGC